MSNPLKRTAQHRPEAERTCPRQRSGRRARSRGRRTTRRGSLPRCTSSPDNCVAGSALMIRSIQPSSAASNSVAAKHPGRAGSWRKSPAPRGSSSRYLLYVHGVLPPTEEHARFGFETAFFSWLRHTSTKVNQTKEPCYIEDAIRRRNHD